MRKLTHDEISLKRTKLENISSANRMPVYVILNSIRSNYNVGSIFRTSDGAMIEKLYLCGYTPHPPKKEILKTALGATDSVNWEYVKDPLNVIKELKVKGIKICALELTENSKPYFEISGNNFPLALVVGNEISGVSQEILDHCDFSIEIPQYGIKQSLNVAVAYGIAIYEMRKIFDSTSI
ncbi:rRNA methylase [Ignavibacterium album JCM 16511]|uniref:rRNA methylase n=1 Tax=Ignavibacterium album (strain DSM 19864 / JCM 16511 / NBRC 101810 / Mat9-16) TaxID=945713 RepID=I0ALX5_IGNAJ|nr:RNA methyltransferase [Ignavibacterium album]AFH49982.1 rRNA methylase [Ignavibacterium album JCM 16511]